MAVREHFCKKTNLSPIRDIDLVISTFGRARSQHAQRAKVFSITLRSQHENVSVQIEAIVMPFICEEMIEVPPDNQLFRAIVAEGKPLADAVVFPGITGETGLSLLIGSNQMWKLMPNSSEVKWDTENRSLVAINTNIGWTIQGPLALTRKVSRQTSSQICVLCVDAYENEELSFPLQRFREMEAIGMVDTPSSKQEGDVWTKFNETIKFQDGRHEVVLPWKSTGPDTSRNRKVALSRLYSLVRRLSSNNEA